MSEMMSLEKIDVNTRKTHQYTILMTPKVLSAVSVEREYKKKKI